MNNKQARKLEKLKTLRSLITDKNRIRKLTFFINRLEAYYA